MCVAFGTCGVSLASRVGAVLGRLLSHFCWGMMCVRVCDGIEEGAAGFFLSDPLDRLFESSPPFRTCQTDGIIVPSLERAVAERWVRQGGGEGRGAEGRGERGTF